MKVNTFGVSTKIVNGVVFISVPDEFVKSTLETNCKPAGKTSRTSTPVAVLGPALFTVIV